MEKRSGAELGAAPWGPCVSLYVEAGPTYKAFCAMKFAPPAIDRFGLSYLADSPDLAAQAQRGLTLAFSEKVLRSLEMSHVVGQVLAAGHGELGLGPHGWPWSIG